MKTATWGIGLVVGGLLTASVAQAGSCCPGHRPAAERVDVARAVPSAVQEKEIKLQTTCPVMGGAIDKAQFVDHDGKRIYVCCQGCVAAVENDPAKYIKSMEEAGVTLHKADEAGEAAEPAPAPRHHEHRH